VTKTKEGTTAIIFFDSRYSIELVVHRTFQTNPFSLSSHQFSLSLSLSLSREHNCDDRNNDDNFENDNEKKKRLHFLGDRACRPFRPFRCDDDDDDDGFFHVFVQKVHRNSEDASDVRQGNGEVGTESERRRDVPVRRRRVLVKARTGPVLDPYVLFITTTLCRTKPSCMHLPARFGSDRLIVSFVRFVRRKQSNRPLSSLSLSLSKSQFSISLLRFYISGITNSDEYEQGVLKYMAVAKVSRSEATGNVDAKLNNAMDWMYQKKEEAAGKPKVDYTKLDRKQALLTTAWAVLIIPLVVQVVYETVTQF